LHFRRRDFCFGKNAPIRARARIGKLQSGALLCCFKAAASAHPQSFSELIIFNNSKEYLKIPFPAEKKGSFRSARIQFFQYIAWAFPLPDALPELIAHVRRSALEPYKSIPVAGMRIWLLAGFRAHAAFKD